MRARVKLQDAVVIVTGAGSGIGRLLCLAAAAKGARVALWDLNLEAAERVAHSIRRIGGSALALQVDVTDAQRVNAANRIVEHELGPVDILVNNAGIVTGSRISELTPEHVRRTFAVNVESHFHTTKAVLPGMRERDHGLIVTIASAAGLVGVARQSDYAASKFAAVGFSESLRNELRSEGSRVSTLTVCPYYIDTGMFEGVTTKVPLLLPIMKPRFVAAQIIRAIEQGRSRLTLPWFARSIFAIHLLPTALADRILDLFGLNEGMDHFTGRGTASTQGNGDAR